MIRTGNVLKTKWGTTAVLLLILLLSFATIGCGNFFVSGNSLNTISLTPTSVFLTVGNTKQFSASGTTVNGDSKDVTSSAKWSSSSSTTATVAAGLVTAVAAGNATITASQDGVEDTAGIIVNTSDLTSIDISATSTTVTTGSTLQLTATATFADSSQKVVTNQVAWTSGSTSTATVSSAGLVTGVAIGTATITATVTTASSTVTKDITITVQ